MNTNYVLGHTSDLPIMQSKCAFFPRLFWGLFLVFYPYSAWSQLAQFNFSAPNHLSVSTKDAKVTVSDMGLSVGTIEKGITTGTYFPNEPYIQETGGWTAKTQTLAKNYNFTITAASGFIFSITNISFKAYATSSGPSAYGVAIDSTNIGAVNALKTKMMPINQAVSGQTGLTKAVVKIQGWVNGSRAATGNGIFRLDDVIVTGVLTPVEPPSKFVIKAIVPSTPSVGSGFSVTIQSQDPNNNPSNIAAATAFSLTTNGNAGAIGGTTTGTIPLGSNSVTLSGVTLSTVGTGATITATRTSGDALAAATSPPFSVLLAATKLAFVGVPTFGSTLTNLIPFTVEARRPDNTLDVSYTGIVSLNRATGTDTLSGALTATAVSGVASFNNIQVGKAGTYTLNATATGLAGTVSGDVVVSLSSIIGWSNASTATAWYTAGNWNPSTASSAWLPAQIATFSNIGTATKAGINMGTSALSIGTLEVTAARTRSLTIENSSTTVGTLTLNGTTTNELANTILRNSGTSTLTIQNGTGTTMNLALGNAVDNVIAVDGAGSIDIGSTITGVGKNLTLDGAGLNELSLLGTNTFSGTFRIKNGTANIGNNGALGAATSVVIESNGYMYSTVGLTNAINDNADLILNGDATIDLNGGNETIASLASTSETATLSIGDTLGYRGSFTVGNATNTTFSGVVAGSRDTLGAIFIKQGTGKLTLTGENTYDGLSNINAGILQLNRLAGNTILTTNDVTINGGTLQISTNQTLKNLVLNGGNVVVDDGVVLTISGTLTLTSGKITLGTTGSGNVIMGELGTILPVNPTISSYIITNGTGTLTQSHAANVSKIYPIGASAASFDPAKITPDLASAFKVKVAASINPNYTLSAQQASTATPRQWDIALLSGTPTVGLSLTSGDLSRAPVGNSGAIGRWNTTAWQMLPANYAAGTWTATEGISTYTSFIVSQPNTPLSITLSNFAVEAQKDVNALFWTTSAEKNNAYFDIQYATDDLLFKSIGKVNGQGTANTTQNYAFNHVIPVAPSFGLATKTHYYRLKQVDFDATETLSKIVSVESTSKNEKISLYPTAAADKLTVNGQQDTKTTYSIFNLLGQNVQSGQLNAQKEVMVSNLLTGIYVLKIGNSVAKFFKN